MTLDPFGYLDYRRFLRDWFDAENRRRAREGARPLTHRALHEAAGLGNIGTFIQILEHDRRLTVALLNHFRAPLGVEPGSLEEQYLRALIDLETAEKRLEEAEERLRREAASPPERSSRKVNKVGIRESRRKVGARSAAERGALDAREALTAARAAVRALQDMHRARKVEGQLREILASLLTTAILELARRPGFQADPDWITAHLRLSADPAEIETALDALRRVGAFNQDGSLAPIFRTPEEVPAEAVRDYYLAAHAASGRALAEVFGPERLAAQPLQRLGALTVAVPRGQVPAFQRLLVRLQNEVASFLQGLEGDRDEVYQLFLHLFPLSRRRGSEEEGSQT